jgi:hypothetical protein
VFISRAHPCVGNGSFYATGGGLATRLARFASTTTTSAGAPANHHDNDRATANHHGARPDNGAGYNAAASLGAGVQAVAD